MSRIVVIGSLNMDLVMRTPRIPIPGETIIGHDFFTAPGGKGANQAVAAARMGAQVAMIGRVGKDDFGRALRKSLTSNGVDCRFVVEDDSATGVASILVDGSGQNSIVVAPGANARLTPGDVERAVDAIAGADVMLLQLEIPLETVTRAAQLGREHGVVVVLNPAPAQSDLAELLTFVDILIPNESEAALLAGQAVDASPSLQSAIEAMSEIGVETLIVTLGAKGALLSDSTGQRRIPAFPVAAIDATAAGDAFVGGFAVALAEKRPLQQAIKWGNAAGGLAATSLGAQPSLPTRQAVLELMSSKA